MAIPVHGDDGARHLLIRVAAIAVLGALVAVAGCGGGAPATASGTGSGAVSTPSSAGALRALLGTVAGAPDREGAWTASSPRFPADLVAAPDAPLEVREWLSVLRDGDGAVWGLRQRMVRAAVPGADAAPAGGAPGDAPSTGASPWRFAAVVRVDGTLEAPDGTRRHWSAVEREAVGLAGIADGAGAGLRLLGHALESVGPLPDAGCRVDWRLRVPGVARLEAGQRACPVGATLAGTLAATLGPFAVGGTLEPGGADGADGAVRGIAWQRLTRGALPVPDGAAAVSFDRAVLALEGIGGLELLRSRRTSGRGTPRTTLAALDDRARAAGAVDSLEVRWTPPADGAPARDAGRLAVPALGIDVALRALSPVAAEDDGLERAFRGAVIAGGTHRGAGFVELRPVGARSGAADGGEGPEA